jgi:cytochrome c-type biogenesis protein CcmH
LIRNLTLSLVLAGSLCAAAQPAPAPAAPPVAQEGALRVPDAAQFVGAPAGRALSGSELNTRTHEVGSLLRCPVCQGMSIADSPSEMAVNMKEQVRELLARGYTEEQILQYFEKSYGQFVLLKPKFEGVTGAVWLLPLVALAIGAVILVMKLRKLEATPQRADAEPETAAQQPVEDPYLARVRDMVGGGKP